MANLYFLLIGHRKNGAGIFSFYMMMAVVQYHGKISFIRHINKIYWLQIPIIYGLILMPNKPAALSKGSPALSLE
jgi:hypothetical protein